MDVLKIKKHVWQSMYEVPRNDTKRNYYKGDRIRLAQAKKNFKRGYMTNRTEELLKLGVCSGQLPLSIF